MPDLVGSRTLAFSVSRDEMGVGVPVRQGEPLSWLYTQCGHLAKQVTKRERKIFVFIHGNTLETEMQPQTGQLFKTKAAASSNLASHLMQARMSVRPGKGRRSEPPSAPGPGGKPCPPVCPQRTVLFERQGAAHSTVSHVVFVELGQNSRLHY